LQETVAEILQPGYPFLILEITGQISFLNNYKQLSYLSEFLETLRATAGQPTNFEWKRV
jgi:hypothetical protein